MKPIGTQVSLRSLARLGGRAAMLLFCVMLAAAVLVEALRQHLAARHVPEPRQRSFARVAALAGWLVCAMLFSGRAGAEMLVSDTSLVSGTQTSVFAFATPAPGTVTVELADVGWPQPLSSLNFLVSSGSSVLSAWTPAGSAPAYFRLGSGGTFFADVTGTAAGTLDLGVYSLEIQFTPATSPVPLPASGGLLLVACLSLLALLRAVRSGEQTSSTVTTS